MMYKQSAYNYFVPYKNKVLYFNALTKSKVLMSYQEHEKLQKQFSDPISFELGFPSVLAKFSNWGFFVEEGVDELALFRFYYNRDILYSKDCHIIILLSQDVLFNSGEVDVLKKHVDGLLKEGLSSLCIEWEGDCSDFNVGLYKDSVTEYAKSLCVRVGIDYEEEYPLLAPRMFQYTLRGREVYSGKPSTYIKKEQIGVLNDDGRITWNEQRRACQIGNIWFETMMCRNCKHLPLMSLSCQSLLQKSRGVCPLKNEAIQPDWVVIQEYELQKV